jgi:peptide deformylase
MTNPKAPLEILEFPDPRLRRIAQPVTDVDGRLVALADAMLETMYAAPGIGLAATQVNVHKRLLVLDVSEEKNQPLILINPELREREGEIETPEGCLSVPGFWEPVTRAGSILVRGVNRSGAEFELEAHGLLAVCIQHEMDHLDGKLFVDYVSPIKRQLIRKKLVKAHRARA